MHLLCFPYSMQVAQQLGGGGDGLRRYYFTSDINLHFFNTGPQGELALEECDVGQRTDAGRRVSNHRMPLGSAAHLANRTCPPQPLAAAMLPGLYSHFITFT